MLHRENALAVRQEDAIATVATAELRSNMYGFLALVYRQEPGAELLDRLESVDFRTALEMAGVSFGKDITSGAREALRLDLAVEYTRLFIGPGKHISPHESVYCQNGEGGIRGKETADVRHFIETAGFQFRADNSLIPDHIAVELEFMHGLARHESRAWAQGEVGIAAEYLGIQARFLKRHLAKWAPGFCKKVIAEARLSFYRELAALTADFIEQEQVTLNNWLAQLKECL